MIKGNTESEDLYSCLFETMVTLQSVGDNTNTGGLAVVGVVTSNFIPATFPGKRE